MGKNASFGRLFTDFVGDIVDRADSLAESLVDRANGTKTFATDYGRRKIVDSVTYEQLKDFLREYSRNNPSVYGCHIFCNFEDDRNRFKIAQLMTDVNGVLIGSGNNRYIGRVFYVRRISEDILNRMGRNTSGEFEIQNILTYNELFEFVKYCRQRYAAVWQCSTSCLWNDETSEYKVTQIMLDRNGNPVKKNDGEYVGRSVAVRALDEMITLRLNNKQADEFMISLN